VGHEEGVKQGKKKREESMKGIGASSTSAGLGGREATQDLKEGIF